MNLNNTATAVGTYNEISTSLTSMFSSKYDFRSFNDQIS